MLPEPQARPGPRRRAGQLLAIGLIWALLTASPAHGARPMITDDARLVDAKACQIESWHRSNVGSAEWWALPACNFTGNIEWTTGGARTREGGVTRTTDQVFQAKTLLRTLDAGGWAVGVVAGVVRHPGVARAEHDVYAYVPLTVIVREDQWFLHTNAGGLRVGSTGQSRLTWGVASESLLPGMAERLWLVAETFGQSGGRASYQAGLRLWIVPNRVQVDATYGNRLGGGNDGRWVSIGLRLLSPAFLP